MDCTYQLFFRDKKGGLKKSARFKIKTGLNIKKEEKKISIEMQELLFKKNSASLSKDARIILDKVLQVLKKHKHEIKNISIEGHSDDTGDKDFNLKLSGQRAETVMNFLTQEGAVKEDKIKAEGYGESKPTYPNDTKSNRRKNRRVKIAIFLK